MRQPTLEQRRAALKKLRERLATQGQQRFDKRFNPPRPIPLPPIKGKKRSLPR